MYKVAMPAKGQYSYYDSKEMLEEKLMWAIKEASGFGFG
jgi:hypothetical protein